ncbi:MAG: adenosylmethionine--8-amino-7-oxononanoate transaminase [Candidatus Tantalella remota]|nr:adenosylmethionine--8-amino-7-oxononanoate transaminase [Candidatus Tantalella remota]
MRNDLIKRDLKYNWHPYTQMKDMEEMPPIPIKKAEGVKLFDYDGNFYYDTISSWWCNVHGHCHPAIVKAIKDQLGAVEHVLFAGFTHEPAVDLAERLVKITPEGLDRVFYSDNGSTAVEVAMKMSFQFWLNSGLKGKTKFVSLDRAYHGDTVGTMSVSGVDLYNKKFAPLFFDTFKAATPYCYRCPYGKEKGNCAVECLGSLEEILRVHSREVAALILEPILMGAGGMIIYPADYLAGAARLAEKYNVHLILDEVAAGFGRTGKMFACEHAGVTPDFMCISKGITSGYLPLGVTMTTSEVYEAFYDDHEKNKTFFHGHTYTANPVSCAAACASIDLFEAENTLGNVKNISTALNSFLEGIADHPMVGDTRTIGAVGAIELVKDPATGEPLDPKDRVGLSIYRQALKHNLLLRPLGDIIYLFLPLSVTPEELKDILSRTGDVLQSCVKEVRSV